MCDLTMALTLGSTLLGAAGTIQQANATAAANRYNAQVAEMNATLSERRAKDAIERGQTEEQRKRLEVQRLLGKQRVGFAAGNLDLSFGSPLDTMVDTAVLGELDALTIRSNAYREAYDHRVDAVNQRAGATLNRASARSATAGGWLGAAGTILGGAGQAYRDFRAPRIGVIA